MGASTRVFALQSLSKALQNITATSKWTKVAEVPDTTKLRFYYYTLSQILVHDAMQLMMYTVDRLAWLTSCL